MIVPFLDLQQLNLAVESDLTEAFRRVLHSGHYILGEEVEVFEHELAAHEGADHCVAVGSGLDALSLMLQATGVRRGDEVIVPSHTFIATWLAVSRLGATPVPVEPREDTYNLDPGRLEAAITSKTVAILPVHLYGQPAEMDHIGQIAEQAGIPVLADAAQSVGASYGGAPLGTWADASAMSFYPGKNLGALGDGGAVLTNDRQLAERVRSLRNYGSRAKYVHDEAGVNSRLDELQAALLRVKLAGLAQANLRRNEIAERYIAGLLDTDLVLPGVVAGAVHSWHLFVVRSDNRAQLMQQLTGQGVQTHIHYPIPPHRQGAYRELSIDPQPVAELISGSVLSLPMGPHLSDTQVDFVIDAIRSGKHF